MCVRVRVGGRVEGGRRSGLRGSMSTASHQTTTSKARVNHVEANNWATPALDNRGVVTVSLTEEILEEHG